MGEVGKRTQEIQPPPLRIFWYQSVGIYKLQNSVTLSKSPTCFTMLLLSCCNALYYSLSFFFLVEFNILGNRVILTFIY